jgi:hypothetical protein
MTANYNNLVSSVLRFFSKKLTLDLNLERLKMFKNTLSRVSLLFFKGGHSQGVNQ